MANVKKKTTTTKIANSIDNALAAIENPTLPKQLLKTVEKEIVERVVYKPVKEYYRPLLDDFKLGLIYEQRWLNDWRESFLDEDHFDMRDGHCAFMVILANMYQTRGSFYRIKFLDAEDIERQGFKKDDEDDTKFVLQNCTILLNWRNTANVIIMIDDEVVFRGRLLNSLEFKQTLINVGILVDNNRLVKFKQYGDEATKIRR